MSDDNDVLDFVKRNPHLEGVAGRSPKPKDVRDEPEEGQCAAFGYLRGVHERALAIEFRLKNGNREWFPYSWLGPWRYNPSAGLLLKFTGDMVTMVLIRGSNLDALVDDRGINLTDRGLQRQRILWIREMDGGELQSTGNEYPIIDRIEMEEFQSQNEVRTWLQKAVPGFLQR
jgi:hypothetical protein